MTDNLEPPRRPVTGSPQSGRRQRGRRSVVGPSERSHRCAVLPSPRGRCGVDPSTGSAASFMRWIVATTKPGVTVTVGHRRPDSASFDVLMRSSARVSGTRYITVGARAEGHAPRRVHPATHAGERTPSASRFSKSSSQKTDAKDCVGPDSRSVDLLHVAISGSVAAFLRPGAMARGVGVGAPPSCSPTPRDGVSDELDRIAKEVVPDHFRTVRVPLGDDGEALVAQEPIDGSSRSVDLLENVPSAVGSMLTLFGELCGRPRFDRRDRSRYHPRRKRLSAD